MMKKLITIIITIAITTISYAQVNNVINTTRNKILIWNKKSKQWDSEGIVYRPVKFSLKNGVYYVTDKNLSKYTLHTKGTVEKFEKYNTLVFNKATDEDNNKCMFSISTFPDGIRVIAIGYKNYLINYYEK
jgi:hypothetical protein